MTSATSGMRILTVMGLMLISLLALSIWPDDREQTETTSPKHYPTVEPPVRTPPVRPTRPGDAADPSDLSWTRAHGFFGDTDLNRKPVRTITIGPARDRSSD